jgi:hypothetical protein
MYAHARPENAHTVPWVTGRLWRKRDAYIGEMTHIQETWRSIPVRIARQASHCTHSGTDAMTAVAGRLVQSVTIAEAVIRMQMDIMLKATGREVRTE